MTPPEVIFLKTKDNPDMQKTGKKVSEILSEKFNPNKSTAIKMHFGERNSDTHLKPEFVKSIYKSIDSNKKCMMDCTVLYKGERSFASTHRELAKENGFDFGNIVIADGQDGSDDIEIPVENGDHFKNAKIGKKLENYDTLLAVSHFTGHAANGIGGALKNIGMGLGSKAGKLEMHNAFNLEVNKRRCDGCRTCIENCPESAISLVDNKAEIDFDKCMGCGKCISVCPNGAVRIPWGDSSSRGLQEKIAEYAKAAIRGKKNYNITALIDITKDCDCTNRKQEKMMEDKGVLLSRDPVAIDQAAIDIVGESKMHGGVDYTRQVKHAEKIGIGSRDYELIEKTI